MADGLPEEVADVFVDAMSRLDFPVAAEVVHPEALAFYAKPFREKDKPRVLISQPLLGGRPKDLYEQMNALHRDAGTLSDAEIFVRWMQFHLVYGVGDRPVERKPGVEVVGSVIDEPHAYVLIKTGKRSLDAFKIPSVETLRMKREGDTWRVIPFAHKV